MTGRIRLLPDGVVNQIAAGEVVERPASVLKELLENAADAGGKRIEAEVGGTFPFTLRVSDDGCGMTPEEAREAIRRHTTSKIASAEDLRRIVTYGFRGEALPSIASVSRMRIVTRPPGQAAATEIAIEGGLAREPRETGAPPGTTVEVSDLFWNVPARRKFLKSPRTEMAHLWDVFHAVALPGEGIFFRMSDGRSEFAYDAREPRADRAMRLAGDEGKYLVRIDRPSLFFRLSGLVGLPQVSRLGAGGQRFFVNGRHFRDKGVFAALREAYRGILAADRQPVACLFIECDPAEVDVNVHPGKTEVRFRYARELFELVRHAVGRAVGDVTRATVDLGGVAAPGRDAPRAVGAAPAPRGEFAVAPLFGNPPAFEEPGGTASPDPLQGGFSSLRPVGQILGTYIVCEGGGDVVIVDQHAAGERIVFSRLKDSFLGKNAPVQRWLVPKVVAISGIGPEERAEILSFLAGVGFLCEAFGEGTFKFTGGPAILGAFDLNAWWTDFRDFLQSQEAAPKGIFDADRELWRMACHAAVRAGKPLERDGMRALLHDLDRAVAAHSCPHGRPVWVKISGTEMDRMFGRS
ncbi:MAG: DNA mismatch repair endonuclease MutL [Gemmatimonadota bacterium]